MALTIRPRQPSLSSFVLGTYIGAESSESSTILGYSCNSHRNVDRLWSSQTPYLFPPGSNKHICFIKLSLRGPEKSTDWQLDEIGFVQLLGYRNSNQEDITMDEVYDQLTSRAKSLQSMSCSCKDTAPYRILIALAGPPGSGKSTVAAEVVQRLNQTPETGNAIVLPMDGFHLTRATLQELPNKEEAFARRGVYWTYNAEGVLSLAEALHATRTDRSIVHLAPCFDHATKDPVEDEIKITSDVSLVIMEGNWLLFDEQPWSKISQIVDDTWFVDVDSDLALSRVAKRHIQSGIESTWEEAVRRTKNNDMINGDLVRAKLITPAIRVRSVETSNKSS